MFYYLIKLNNFQIFNFSGMFQWSADRESPTAPPRSFAPPRVPGSQPNSVENKAQGKGKLGKVKGKGKKGQNEDDSNTSGASKLWYEARTTEGHSYFWHIETNGRPCTRYL